MAGQWSACCAWTALQLSYVIMALLIFSWRVHDQPILSLSDSLDVTMETADRTTLAFSWTKYKHIAQWTYGIDLLALVAWQGKCNWPVAAFCRQQSQFVWYIERQQAAPLNASYLLSLQIALSISSASHTARTSSFMVLVRRKISRNFKVWIIQILDFMFGIVSGGTRPNWTTLFCSLFSVYVLLSPLSFFLYQNWYYCGFV